MRSLFGAGDSDSEPDAKGKPDASLGEVSKSHADAGAGAGDAQAPDIMPVVVWHDTMMAAPAMAESIVAAATGVQANTPPPIEAAASDVVAEVALPRADVAAPDDASAHLSITPQITMSTRPPSATPSPLLTGNGFPIPALRAITDSQVASAPHGSPFLSPLSQCTAHCSAQLFVTHS